jgi:hypothetical protein
MAVGLFTGLFWIIGAVWAMVKKGEARGTIFEDHYSIFSFSCQLIEIHNC